jgi:hypothetical protein
MLKKEKDPQLNIDLAHAQENWRKAREEVYKYTEEIIRLHNLKYKTRYEK